MARSIHADTLAALQSDGFRLAHLIHFGFATPIYITDYAHDLAYGGNTYDASPHLLKVPPATETRDLRVNSCSITLSGAEQSYISIMLQEQWINRQVTIEKAVISATGAVIGTPITIFEGQITEMDAKEGAKKSTVTIKAASHWADFQKTVGRYTNTKAQQYYFAGDLGFDYAADSVRDLKWGSN